MAVLYFDQIFIIIMRLHLFILMASMLCFSVFISGNALAQYPGFDDPGKTVSGGGRQAWCRLPQV